MQGQQSGRGRGARLLGGGAGKIPEEEEEEHVCVFLRYEPNLQTS